MAGRRYNVAIVGATGMVGAEFIKVLEERNFPVDKIRLLASGRSKGKRIKFLGAEREVEELKKDSFSGIEIALFSAGASISKQFAPLAAKAGAIVVDNSSAFRMEADVPLVVPEVNPHAIARHKGIIANPNCSTIQMVVALKPLHDAARIKRIVVATYQSVSGWGKEAVEQLWNELEYVMKKRDNAVNRPHILDGGVPDRVLPGQIAFNVIPHIDVFLENGYTREEMKMVNETRKIMEDDSINISATCVRVPVLISHSEAVNIEFERHLSPAEARALLENAPGVKVIDGNVDGKYPLPLSAEGEDWTYVGRIRKDDSVKNGLSIWVVSDNLRKGAALNAVQIAEHLIK